MRFGWSLVAGVLALALAGCPGSDNPVYGQVLYTDAGCRVGCDKCPINTICVSAPYHQVCLQKCTLTSDCATGQKCALLDLPHENVSTCVTADRPYWCSKQPCNIAPRCRDVATLLQPLDFSELVCGWEIVHCVNGCDAATAQCK